MIFDDFFILLLNDPAENLSHSLRHSLTDELSDEAEDLIMCFAENGQSQSARFLALLEKSNVRCCILIA